MYRFADNDPATPAQPTRPGAIENCGRYYTVTAGDTCELVALRFGISSSDLRKYNTYIDDDCKNLWIGYSVCVAPVTNGPASKD